MDEFFFVVGSRRRAQRLDVMEMEAAGHGCLCDLGLELVYPGLRRVILAQVQWVQENSNVGEV